MDTRGPRDDDTWWAYPRDLVLSFDAASFRGTDLCITIARLAPERRVLTILANDRITTRDAWFARLPADVRARIRGVCLDMPAAHRTAIQRICLHVQVVLGPFHVVPDGTHQLDAVRRLEPTATSPPSAGGRSSRGTIICGPARLRLSPLSRTPIPRWGPGTA